MLPPYTIRYSYRKTVGIRIDRKGNLTVSAPIWVSAQRVHTFVASKTNWIMKKIEQIQKNMPDHTIEVTRDMKDHALIQILPRVEYYAQLMNVWHRYTDIKITTAQTKRWSCSSRGVLMFHWKLSQFPLGIVDYVVVHELAHLVHFNHSANFWNLVEQYHPEYTSSKKRLKEHGNWLSVW
jgi:predicted metal-dependent hydrolase